MCNSPINVLISRNARFAALLQRREKRLFHDYFITHLPSSSLHPDAKSRSGPHHKLPREKSVPHSPRDSNRSPAATLPNVAPTRDTTVVRIPIRSAKHHFGATLSRGSRPYNEDSYQAGTIDLPAFAKRRPISLTRNGGELAKELRPADGATGDPQVFYFGVFDGHGGVECSAFLKEQLHEYIENGGKQFELESTLKTNDQDKRKTETVDEEERVAASETIEVKKAGEEALKAIEIHNPSDASPLKPPDPAKGEEALTGTSSEKALPASDESVKQSGNLRKAEGLERELVKSWKELVGGYFRRFKPDYFSLSAGGKGHTLEREMVQTRQISSANRQKDLSEGIGIETVLSYAFLKADYDFVQAQADKDEDQVLADRALNADDILHRPSMREKPIGGPKRFKGGSTCSIALVSTPTPTPFWHPASPSTIVTCHVGDTRIILCNTATGEGIPLTTNHHPSVPKEAARLRRYAATFVTDSFGEERVSGLANTRAFGDMASKRIGVSAEPEIRRIELGPAEYAFLVLVSDGISGTLSDQEIVDIVKEARTPEQGARDVVNLATEVAADADNATAMVVRLGGWERRSEGGLGSMGTKELRDWRREEAESPRGRR